MDVDLAYRIKYLIEEIGSLQKDIRTGEEAKKTMTAKEYQLKELMINFVGEEKKVKSIAQ